MSINRNNIARGRGQVTLGGQTIFPRGEITVDFIQRTFQITKGGSTRDTRDRDRLVEIRLTPTGRITSGLLGVFYPHLTKVYGAKALGSSDAAAVVYLEANDISYTIHNAVVFKQPDLNLQAGQTPFGELVIHGLVKNSTDPGATDSYFTEASATYPDDAAFDPSAVKAGLFTAAWGSSPWDSFRSNDGFRVSFNTQMIPDGEDSLTRDYIVGNQAITVACRPKAITEQQLMAKIESRFQDASAPLGSTSIQGASPDDLNISNDDLYFRLYNAGIASAPRLVGKPDQDIVGALTFFADRSETSGVETAVGYVGTSAPA